MKKFKPGSSVRVKIRAKVEDVPFVVTSLVVTLHAPDGTSPVVDSSPVTTSAGYYLSDSVLPMSAVPGPWIARAQATGVAANQNALKEIPFEVEPLAF